VQSNAGGQPASPLGASCVDSRLRARGSPQGDIQTWRGSGIAACCSKEETDGRDKTALPRVCPGAITSWPLLTRSYRGPTAWDSAVRPSLVLAAGRLPGALSGLTFFEPTALAAHQSPASHRREKKRNPLYISRTLLLAKCLRYPVSSPGPGSCSPTTSPAYPSPLHYVYLTRATHPPAFPSTRQ
jgi:hypothetical protein